MKKISILSPYNLALMAIFSALSIVLTRFLSVMLFGGALRLGFGSIPIILSGILLGPVGGGLTGVISDLLGVILNPQGKFHLGFTLSSCLTGVLPGIVVLIYKKTNTLTVIISNLLVYLFVSLCLNTFWLSQLFGKGFFVLLPTRALAQGIVTVVSIILVEVIWRSLKVAKLLRPAKIL